MQVVDGYGGRKVAHKSFQDNKSILRLFMRNREVYVVTAYITSQISRY